MLFKLLLLLGAWLIQTALSNNASMAASYNCHIGAFTSMLDSIGVGDVAKVVYASPIEEGGSSFDPSPPFQNNVTHLPEVCAVKIEVQSSESSAYRFAMFLPSEGKWNGRMMTTGNGGFGGGINVSWLVSGCK